jgi:hypothetical protein
VWILEEEVEIPDKRRKIGIVIVIAFSAMGRVFQSVSGIYRTCGFSFPASDQRNF